jgi:hypothetical protein
MLSHGTTLFKRILDRAACRRVTICLARPSFDPVLTPYGRRIDGGSRGGDGPGWRRLGRQPERVEQAPHGVGLGHRTHNQASERA